MARDRREKFVVLAEKRVKKTIKDIELIGNLADKSNYCYNDDQVSTIIAALDAELDNLKARFARKGEPDIRFSLRG